MVDKLYVEWSDVDQRFLRTSNYVATPAGVAAYITALQNISNAGIQQRTSGLLTILNNVAVDAQFPSDLDTAVMLFATTAAGTIRVTVPAPKASIFQADNLTVSQIATLPFQAAVAGALGDVLGNAATFLVSGVRADRRKDLT